MTIMQEHLSWSAKYSKWHSFLLKNGQSFTITEDTFAGPRMEQHMCYMNATHLMLEKPELTYCEGLMSLFGVPIEHAWCCNKQGEVIDPTIRSPDNIREYFGIPFERDYVYHSVMKNKVYGLLDPVFTKTAHNLILGKTKNFKAPIAQLVRAPNF